MKKKIRMIVDILLKHSKIVFPLMVIVVVAITVALALGAKNLEPEAEEQDTQVVPETLEAPAEEKVIPQIELVRNEDGPLYTLMATYYNALANSDVETIQSISNYVEDTEIIRIQELGKYIDTYPLIEIYTKPGPMENSYVAYVYTEVTFDGYEQRIPGLMTFYVCTNEQGDLYLNEGEATEEVLEYIKTINLQDDVVELNNKVNTQYNDVMMANKELFDYLVEMEKLIKVRIGEILAAQLEESEAQEETEQDDAQSLEGDGAAQTEAEEQQEQAVPAVVYATATTTVNVRSSDSQQADKLGKIAGSARVQVLEQKANGWTKIVFENKEGYVKSEYLVVEGAASTGAQSTTNNTETTGTTVIKTVTATTNVNLRKEPSETAEKICVVVGGDTLEVLSEANGWSQVRYSGKTGYVKSEFTQ